LAQNSEYGRGQFVKKTICPVALHRKKKLSCGNLSVRGEAGVIQKLGGSKPFRKIKRDLRHPTSFVNLGERGKRQKLLIHHILSHLSPKDSQEHIISDRKKGAYRLRASPTGSVREKKKDKGL